VYLASLRGDGRRTQTRALNLIAELLGFTRPEGDGGPDTRYRLVPWAGLRYAHTQAIRAQLADRAGPAMANKALSALRRVLKEAWRLEQMSAEDYQRAADLAPVKAQRLPAGRALPDDELAALLRVCAADEHPLGARDAALIAILAGAGLRRSEVVALDLADYQAATAALRVRGGKGNKDRLAYLDAGAQHALEAWLSLRGRAAGPLLLPVHWRGQIQHGKRLTAQAVLYALQKRARSAGIAAFTPHDLRRTFISDLLDAGADIATVQQLAGHANIATTARYDRRGEEAKRKAIAKRRTPYP
jgi:site-specific recombinase XerD